MVSCAGLRRLASLAWRSFQRDPPPISASSLSPELLDDLATGTISLERYPGVKACLGPYKYAAMRSAYRRHSSIYRATRQVVGSAVFALIQLFHVICATAGVKLSTGFISVSVHATGAQPWFAYFVVTYLFVATAMLHLVPWRCVIALASRGWFDILYLVGAAGYVILMAIPFVLRRYGDPFELNTIGQTAIGLQLLDANVAATSLSETVVVSMGIVGGGLVHNPFLAFCVVSANIIGQTWRMGALRTLAFDSLPDPELYAHASSGGGAGATDEEQSRDFYLQPVWTTFVWTAMGTSHGHENSTPRPAIASPHSLCLSTRPC
jgi:hypothetical protein